MVKTEFGIIIEVSPLHPWNAPLSIDVTELGRAMEVMCLHP